MLVQRTFFQLSIVLILSISCVSKKDINLSSTSDSANCLDLVYSDLTLKFVLSDQQIKGSNKIYFNSTCLTDTIVIDLFNNFNVDSVRLNNNKVKFYREHDVIQIVNEIVDNSLLLVEVFYHGCPNIAKNPPWDGGVVWSRDSENLDWVGIACQKESGSLWFPSKHDLSDEPDSVRVSFSVPSPYVAVSNGTLISVKQDPKNNDYNIFEWLVKNPINNYNITFNIANYTHFKDTLISDAGVLKLDYYVLPDNFELAKQHFEQVKPMLNVFENIFGPYPFYDDGYKLVETAYLGMEHQSCISYGNKFMKGYLGSFPANIDFDFIIIHETAHEWWGNSVSMEHIRDMWIHESFATYAEALYVEKIYGYNDMLLYLNYQKGRILNQEPIINDEHTTTDMYYKGSWILHTLRTVLRNDAIWMDILKGLQFHFRHQIVNTADVIEYIEKECGYNLNAFFEQYLYFNQLPVLEYFFTEQHNITLFHFKWNAVSPDFDMPVLVKINQRDTYSWIYPHQEWDNVQLTDIDIEDFKVAHELLLLETKLVK